jgi:hypothetical protein
LVELAAERRRFRHRRLCVLLLREDSKLNHKRTYRLCREPSLAVRQLRRRLPTAS